MQSEEGQISYPEEANFAETASWPPHGYHRKSLKYRPIPMTAAHALFTNRRKEASAAQSDGDQSCCSELKAGSRIPAMLEISIRPSFIVNPYSTRRAGITPNVITWCNAASERLHNRAPAAPSTIRKPSRTMRCRHHRKSLKQARSGNSDAPSAGTASMIRLSRPAGILELCTSEASLQLKDTCTPS